MRRRDFVTILGALVDTNCDPDEADYVVPGNDDAIKSCDLVIRTIADAIEAGKQKVKPEEFKEQTSPEPAAAAEPVAEEGPAAEETAPAEEAPAVEETAPANAAAAVGETAQADAAPAAEETPPALAAPAAEETAPAEEVPAE